MNVRGLEVSSRIRHRTRAIVLVAALAAAACVAQSDDSSESTSRASQAYSAGGDGDRQASCGDDKAIRLALEVDNGAGVPVKVKKGQRFYVNQIDLRAAVTATTDEGVDGLKNSGDFASLHWKGTELVDQSFVLLANADGTFTRRRFYRGADWMDKDGTVTFRQLDGAGRPLSSPIKLDTGSEEKRTSADDFFTRRYRAIQWTNDCVSTESCAGATKFSEEALVELRYGEHPNQDFVVDSRTRAFELRWSANPSKRYTIPVEQVERPQWDYGFAIDVKPLTPARPNGTYAPGDSIKFQLTLRDGNGKRLHAPGSLPTYNEVIFEGNPAGIQYYGAFFDPTATYYRRKHRERMLMAELIGPVQSPNLSVIRSPQELSDFLDKDVQTVGTIEKDGVYSQFMTIPPGPALFGGAFDPTHAGWAAPVSDTWTFKIADNAPPGTYLAVVKGRRVYLGEDIPASKVIEIQVGTPQKTQATLHTGNCTTCHKDESSFAKVNHGLEDRRVCAGCHVPLGFELEGPIPVRTHFVHSRTGTRFGGDLSKCATCHLDRESIQRTSKSACLSCHKSYPDWHVAKFGPIEDMYIGGRRESFDQCSTTCHTDHPNSHL